MWSRWVLALTVLATLGCDFFRDHLKTCRDTRVQIVNSQQTLSPIAIAGPNEDFTAESVLASGASRSIGLCLDRGDRAEFRASRDHVVIASISCVVIASPGENVTPSVVWTLQGFRCEGW
jgi:hypothetical protein